MTKKALFNKFKNINPNDKILLLTHTDLDGDGPAILLKLLFPNVTVQHCANNTMSYDIKNAVCNKDINVLYDTIIVTDISCTEKDAEKINKNPNNKKLILLDHHTTALYLNKYKWACVQNEIIEDSFRKDYYPKNSNGLSSGTSLLYDFLEYKGYDSYINKPLVKTFVHLIATYDTWDWNTIFNKNEKFTILNTLHNIYGDNMFEKEMIKKLTNPNETNLFSELDTIILNIEQNRIDDYLERIKKCIHTGNIEINGKHHSIVFCNSNNYPMETFEMMKTQYPDYDLYLINYGTGLSIRSEKDDIDVGALTKQFGGGGHKGAGGVKIKSDLLIDTIEKTLGSSTLFID